MSGLRGKMSKSGGKMSDHVRVKGGKLLDYVRVKGVRCQTMSG